MGGFNLREIMDTARTFRSQRNNSSSKNGNVGNSFSGNGSGRSGSNSSSTLETGSTYSSSSSSTSSLAVNDLPPEILAHVFSFLSGKDIANAALTCKTFYETSRIDRLWQNLCHKDCGITLHSGQPQSYTQQMYTRLIYKYKSLFGLWQPEIVHYGGLVQVKFENDKIVACEWQVPNDPEYMEPMRRRDLFSIRLSENRGPVEIECLGGFHGPHKCEIQMRNNDHFFSKCCMPDSHRHPTSTEVEYQEWLRNETTDIVRFLHAENHGLLFIKFLLVKQYECFYEHHRLTLPTPRPRAVIQPGIFKGTYGDNGLELVMLAYDDDGYTVKATKITGDQNVPANKITFRADLRYSLVLNELQQLDMETLATLRRSSQCILPENLPRQPFRIPQNCMERGVFVPDQCKARFHGFGQIAGHGFTNASYTPGHWIVFNEDLFGFLWLSLQSLSMYHRVKEAIY